MDIKLLKDMFKQFLCICFILCSLHASAQATLLQQKVSLEYTHATIEQVLRTLSERYYIPFSYSKDIIPFQQKVSIQADNQILSEFLQNLFTNTAVEFALIGEQVVLKKTTLSQVPAIIHGKVWDKINKEPLGYASVQIRGKAMGATTLPSGEFTLKIPPQYLQDTLLISYMGYSTIQKPIKECIGAIIQIELVQETRQLSEVVVQSITGLSILQQAIARIPENYDTAAFNLSFFLREWVFHDGGPIRVNEAVYEGYRGALRENATRQVKLINSRNRKYYAEYKGILSTFPHWTGYEVAVNRHAIFDDISALYVDKKNFPIPGGYTYHDFILSGTDTINGREVYIISFDQKDKYRNKAFYKGTLYIDVATLAVIKSVVDYSPKGIKNVRFFNAPKAAARLLGFAGCTVTKNEVTLTYTQRHGKWYVDSLQTIYETHLVKDKWSFDSFVYYRSNMQVTDVRKDKPLPFEKSAEATNMELHQTSYDKNFWKNYTAVPPDEEFNLAFQQIDSLNQLHPYDEKFWKKYKMDKHPASTPASLISVKPSASGLSVSDNLLLPLTEKKETRHFRFIYSAIDTASIDAIAHHLEDNYQRILSELEVAKLPKVEVTIFPSIRAYHLAINWPDAPAHEVGNALSKEAFYVVSPNNPGPVWNGAFMMKAFVHEFTHCVHYTILEEIPAKTLANLSEKEGEGSWLFEALACYESGQFFPPAKFEYLKNGDHPKLASLIEEGKVYDIGYVIIEYVKTRWGVKALNQLIRTNANIQYCLGISESDFEQGLYAYMAQKYLQ